MRLTTSLIYTTLLLLSSSCRTASTSASATTESGAAVAEVRDPFSAYSGDLKRWLRQLVDTGVENHEIPVGSSARFFYDAIHVSPDGTWRAEATMHLSGERFGCEESGAWSDAEGLSPNEGRITLNVSSSDCVTRSAGGSQRLQIKFEGGGTTILDL